MTWRDASEENGEVRSSIARCGIFRLHIFLMDVVNGRRWLFNVINDIGDRAVRTIHFKTEDIHEAKQEAGKLFSKILSDAMIELEA